MAPTWGPEEWTLVALRYNPSKRLEAINQRPIFLDSLPPNVTNPRKLLKVSLV